MSMDYGVDSDGKEEFVTFIAQVIANSNDQVVVNDSDFKAARALIKKLNLRVEVAEAVTLGGEYKPEKRHVLGEWKNNDHVAVESTD